MEQLANRTAHEAVAAGKEVVHVIENRMGGTGAEYVGHLHRDIEEAKTRLNDHQEALKYIIEGWIIQQDALVKRLAASHAAHDHGISMHPWQRSSQEAPSDIRGSLKQSSHSFDRMPSVHIHDQCLNSGNTLSGINMEQLHKELGTIASKTAPGTGIMSNRFVKRFFDSVRRLEHHSLFVSICMFVLLGNTVTLAIGVEISAQAAIYGTDTPEESLPFLADMELAFCAFYCFEIMVKFLSQRSHYILGADRLWNIFDVAVTTTSAMEQVSRLTGSGESANMSYLRVIRVAKSLKLLRFIRLMRAFRELRMVLDSIMGSMRAMLWTFLLILCIVFMFGLAFVQATVEYLSVNCSEDDECLRLQDSAIVNWGGMTKAMMSLFKASTGGADWGDLAEPLFPAGPQYGVFFVIYVAFFLFVVMNALTSIFVDATIQNSQKDEDEIVSEQLAQKEQYMRKVAVFFHMIHQGEGHELTLEEFQEHQHSPALGAFAASLEIESHDLLQFFTILSSNGARGVDLETFVVGCIKLRGMAKSMDLMDLMISTKKFAADFKEFASYAQQELNQIKKVMLATAPQGGSHLAHPLRVASSRPEVVAKMGGAEHQLAAPSLEPDNDDVVPAEDAQQPFLQPSSASGIPECSDVTF